MSANWIETYLFRDHQYGIEDFEDGQPDQSHFMGGRSSTHHTSYRYIAWKDGRGKLFADLDEARTHLRETALVAVQEDIRLYGSELGRLQGAINTLNLIESDIANHGLGKFKRE